MLVQLAFTPTEKEIKFFDDYIKSHGYQDEIEKGDNKFRDIKVGDLIVVFHYDHGKSRENDDPIGFEITKCGDIENGSIGTDFPPVATTMFAGLNGQIRQL